MHECGLDLHSAQKSEIGDDSVVYVQRKSRLLRCYITVIQGEKKPPSAETAPTGACVTDVRERKRQADVQGDLVFPHRVVRGHAGAKNPVCQRTRVGLPGRGGRRGGSAAGFAARLAERRARLGVDGPERGEGRRGGVSRKGGGDPFDLLVRLVGRIAADELVLLELDDDVWPCVCGADVEAAGRDELDVNLPSGWDG